MAIVSRLKLNHPALGTAGGSALHTQIEGLYEKLGDNIADRLFKILNLNAAASADCDHNYNTNISNIKSDIYSYNEITGEATYLDETTTPKLSQISIIAKVGDEKNQITVTNNSASQVDLLIILTQGVIKLSENDVKDIDIVSTSPEEGQALVWDSLTSKFLPGASGDSSFKFQSINSSGTQLKVKKGYIRLSDGRVLYLPSDLTIDVSTIITTNGYWYAYLDVNTLSASSIVSGRKLVQILSSNFVYSETAPEDNNLTRYIPMGQITRSGGSFTLVTTEAFRSYDFPLGADKSLEYTLPLQAIGSVGSSGQIAAGHILAQGSFPSAAYANTSFYNLTNTTTVNDGNTGLAKNLTNTPSTPFTGTGILGLANSCANLNGSSHYLSSLDTHFDPGDTDFSCGGWFYIAAWSTGSHALFSQAMGAGANSFYITVVTGVLSVNASVNGTVFETSNLAVSGLTGWHHVAIRYVASTNTITLFIDGKPAINSFVLSSNLSAAGSSREFRLGRYSTTYLTGLIDEFFFCNGTAYTDNDISKVFASKLNHARTLSPLSQKWLFTGVSAGGQARELFDNIVDMDTDDLYFDLSDELSTTQVELKLYNRSQTGISKASKVRTLELTTDQLDALLPISHGLGVVPEISFKIKNISNEYEPQDCSAFTLTATQIKLADGSLVSLYGSGVTCILTYATANLAHFVPNRFWNFYAKSSSFALLANDRVAVNTTGGAITGTLPANPSAGDEVEIIDSRNYFGTTAFTFGRNGKPINGVASDFDCDISGRKWSAIFIDETYGWAVI